MELTDLNKEIETIATRKAMDHLNDLTNLLYAGNPSIIDVLSTKDIEIHIKDKCDFQYDFRHFFTSTARRIQIIDGIKPGYIDMATKDLMEACEKAKEVDDTKDRNIAYLEALNAELKKEIEELKKPNFFKRIFRKLWNILKK